MADKKPAVKTDPTKAKTVGESLYEATLGKMAKELGNQLKGSLGGPTTVQVMVDPTTGQAISPKTGAFMPNTGNPGAALSAKLNPGQKADIHQAQSTGAFKGEVDPGEFLRLQSMLGINPKASFSQMGESVENLQDLRPVMAASVAKPQLDLTPVASLVDQWTGSKFTPSYKAPEKPEAGLTRVMGLEKQIGSQAEDLSKAEQEALRSMAFYRKETPSTSTSESLGFNAEPIQRATGVGRLKPIPEGDRNKIIRSQTANSQLDSVINDVKQNPGLYGAGGKLSSYVPSWMIDISNQAGIKSDKIDQIAASQALNRRLLDLKQTLGTEKEGGVLRREDELKYDQIIGNIAKDPKSLEYNLKELKSLLNISLKNRFDVLDKSHGYDLSGYQKDRANIGNPDFQPLQESALAPGKNKEVAKPTPASKVSADLAKKAAGDALLQKIKQRQRAQVLKDIEASKVKK